MNKVLKQSVNVSLHALSIMILLLPVVWFSGGLNWENGAHQTEQSQAFQLPRY